MSFNAQPLLKQDANDPTKQWIEFLGQEGTTAVPLQYTLTPQQFSAFQSAGLTATRESNNPLYYNQGAFSDAALTRINQIGAPLPASLGDASQKAQAQQYLTDWTNILGQYQTKLPTATPATLNDPYSDKNLWAKTPYMGGSQVTYIGPAGGPQDPNKGGLSNVQAPANIQQTASTVPNASVPTAVQSYTVKSGDTLSKIAQQLGVSIGQISGYRSGNPNLIYPGENLTIGGTSGGTPSGQLTPEQAKYFQDQIVNIQKGITSIQNPIPVAGQGATPTLPPQQSGAIAQSYYSSAAQELVNTTNALNAARDKQIADTQAQQATVQQQLDEIRRLESEGILQQGQAAADEKQKKLDLLTEEKARFDENYNIVQGLAGQLQTLLTNGNDLITQQKAQTGLSSIMTPRINQTISDVTAQAGVIQATISAYNGQMNQAQSQLTNASNVITSAFQDQISYYKTLYDFYESQATDKNAQLIVLTKDQKDFLTAKIATLEDAQKTAQTNVDNIKKAMIDKDTALAYALAGVTLNDSQEVINQKLGVYYQTKAIEDNNNTMAKDDWSPLLPGQSAPAGSTLTQTVVNGTVKNWYKKATATTPDNKAVAYYQIKQRATQLFSDGMTANEYKQVQSELMSYNLGGYLSDFDQWISDMGYLTPEIKK